MGNRCLFIFTDTNKAEVSPTVYLHWSPEPKKLIEQIKSFMGDRKGDVSYTAANFCYIARKAIGENEPLSLGIFETPRGLLNDEAAIKDYSHGDEGVYIVNCDDFSYKNYK
jgi:hypothetical protein